MKGVGNEAEGLKPWQMSFNGYFWYNMPGCDAFDKRCNFYLYRTGNLNLQEEKQVAREAEDGIVEVAEFDRSESGPENPRRLVSLVQKRFGSIGRKAEWSAEKIAGRNAERRAAEVDVEADLALRAGTRLRLSKLKQEHLGALAQIAELAGVDCSNLYRFEMSGVRLSTQRLKLVVAVLDKLVSGELKLSECRRVKGGARKKKRVETPEGYVRFQDWVSVEAVKRKMKPHSLYVALKRNPERMPEVLKVHGKAWFVKQQETEEAA